MSMFLTTKKRGRSQFHSFTWKTMLKIIITLTFLFSHLESVRYRVIKVRCSSSNLSCTRIECRLKSISRTNQTLSFGATVVKNLTSPQFKIELSYKTSNNMWRELFKLEKVPICQFMNRSINLPYLDNMMDVYVKVFPTFPRTCPVLTGPYYMRNVTNADYDHLKDIFISNFGGLHINGVYKLDFYVFSARDEDIYSLMMQMEVDLNAPSG